MVLKNVLISFIHMQLSCFPSSCYWRGCLFSIIYFCFFCHRPIGRKCVGLFMVSLYCSTELCLFMCQYHTVLITLAFWYSLKSRNMIPPTLFFLKTVSAIQILLCFHTNFKIIFSSSVKNAFSILTRIALNLYTALNSVVIWAVLILPIQEHGYTCTLLLGI